jgi:hypothetical protein
MKRITLEFSDEAYQKVTQALTVRKLAGMTWGAPEEVIALILDSIEKGEETRTIRASEEKVKKGT